MAVHFHLSTLIIVGIFFSNTLLLVAWSTYWLFKYKLDVEINFILPVLFYGKHARLLLFLALSHLVPF